MTEAQTAVAQAPTVHLDETGWREAGQRAWLWTAVAPTVTLFHIDSHRSHAVVTTLLGPAPTAVVISDRYGAYRPLPLDQRQVCWAHAIRDFQALVDAGATTRPTGTRLVSLAHEVFEWWHGFQAGAVDRAGLDRGVGRVAVELKAILEQGQTAAMALER